VKKVVSFFLSLVVILFSAHNAKAEGEFVTDINVEYNVQERGITEIKYNINLQNVFSDIYATNYSLVFDNITPLNVRAYQGEQILATNLKTEESKNSIEVTFPDAVVGKNKTRQFTISYEDKDIATRTGEVWEIIIPRINQNTAYKTYNLSLSVPVSFGTEAYISPRPIKSSVDKGRATYYFDKNTVLTTGLTAGFGDFQVFSFTIIYHLENPLNKAAYADIAIPPDTSLQKIYFEKLDPKPESVNIDNDGNWIAKYLLKSRERIDVEAKGIVQIFAGPRPFPPPSQSSLDNNLKPTEYWQTQDPEIIKLAHALSTPKKIYEYVSQHLKYDLERVKPNVTRLGASEALKQPASAICMEYTDLFIAIARAAKIPAREINGYAYTENKDIQPLSLVSDVLHSWPEYWDSNKKTWISIDPTWGSTTGGVDFFSKLDLRHFAFVIHGVDPKKPYPPGSYKLGSNPQKDVFINFSKLPVVRDPVLKITYQKDKLIPFLSQKVHIKINNLGPVAYYNFQSNILFDEQINSTKNIEVLVPFSSYDYDIVIPQSILGTKTPSKITVTAGTSSLEILTSKKEMIIFDLCIIFFAFVILLLCILFKLGKIKYRPIIGWAKNLLKRNKKDDDNETIPPQISG